MRTLARVGRAACLAALVACTGSIGDTFDRTGEGGGGGPSVLPGGGDAYGATGMRRLSQTEVRTALTALLGSDPGADVELLPTDQRRPFDNDYTTQQASAALVEGMKAVADRAVARLLADPAQRDLVVGCAPSGPDDEACLTSFVTTFGRLAWRGPLEADEVEAFVTAASTLSVARGDFMVGVSVVIRAMLQSPRFLYHVEIGAPVEGEPGLLVLTGYEIASRLAFLLWGAPPDAALLDDAAAGRLEDADGIRAAAERMLQDPRARAQVDRFHAMWLGYEQIQVSADLASRMRAETDALVERIVFDESRSWLDLFTADETWIDDTLATHYGLAVPGSDTPAWVSYGDSGRGGLLSHGSFLAAVPKFGDTSPTQRGKLIRNRLLCQEIPPPPPNVNADEPPVSEVSDCKWDRYAAHRSTGSCKSCHEQMDPIGFGLERFDETGAYREHDDGAPECPIEGEGELVGVGTFHGPAELGTMLVASDFFDACFVSQLFRFTVGRTERDEDGAWIEATTTRFRENDHRLDALLLAIVADPMFRHRIAE